MSDKPDLTFYAGDTWLIPITLTQTVNGTTAPVDLTGFTPQGNLLVGKTTTPVQASAQSASLQLSQGQVEFVVAASLTRDIPADQPCAAFYPTRFQFITVDPAGNSVTRGVLSIRVVAP